MILVTQIFGLLLGLLGIAYLVLALLSTYRFKEGFGSRSAFRPAVSVLKPVYNETPRLYECLRSYCEQDWEDYEVIFGARSDQDTAVEVVRRLIREFPDRKFQLVIDSQLVGPNRKVSNLANIYKVARHDTILLADSDLRVDASCIAAMVAPLADPSIGAVASMYKGLPVGGGPSIFGALYINDWFLPSVLVDVNLRGIDFVFAMSSVRREALNAIGGFERLAQFFADDFAMGKMITRAGWKVVLSPYACDTVVAEDDYISMFRHEVRWQRTELACRPLDQLLFVITCPLPLLLTIFLIVPSALGGMAILLEVLLRILLHFQVRRSFRISTPPQPWAVPLRECVCFFAWLSSLFGSKIRWGDDTFSVWAFRKLLSR